ncbi:MAG: ARMT1-like domain-containing protein [Desulfohalobiaceae bacterium]
MAELPEFSSVKDLRYGRDPYFDAWLLHFMTENDLGHFANPRENASPEQMRFMVVLDDNQVFAPCSDEMLRCLLEGEVTDLLLGAYREAWRSMVSLVRANISDTYQRRKIVALCRHKFRRVLSSPFLIPSRMLKRLLTILLTQSALVDPLREEKKLHNERACHFVNSPALDRFLNACPEDSLGCSRIEDLRWELDLLELSRLLSLSTQKDIWTRENFDIESLTLEEVRSISPSFEPILTRLLGPGRSGPLKILFLPDQSGGVVIDMRIIQSLLRQGHRVILALKEEFFFHAPTFWDREHDPCLRRLTEGAMFLPDSQISKNSLLQALREHRLLVISDGSRERLNLYRTSVTFARAWKESDLVIAKGEPNYRRLILNSNEFTRDILSYYRDKNGVLQLHYKPCSPSVHKFSERELLYLAENVIRDMRAARSAGKNVMFYSAIIGSIPGQTETAITILTTFINYLRDRLENTFIINPAEQFEPGLDADDLMYMWEKVQRSGLIDVWRFQTVEDIEKSFHLLGQKVPPIWTGKDATFSTGCTKEMNIALEMQQRQPELQIIGPSAEKFFRRREYGVGKFFDVSIER